MRGHGNLLLYTSLIVRGQVIAAIHDQAILNDATAALILGCDCQNSSLADQY